MASVWYPRQGGVVPETRQGDEIERNHGVRRDVVVNVGSEFFGEVVAELCRSVNLGRL
jgi:hypothetical protein